jgi:SAM-dependent methyltransferase
MTTMQGDSVKDFWQTRAQQAVSDGEVTHPDIWQRWLEIELIKRFIAKSDRVLDVGCGNGYTSRAIAPLAREVIGIDYSEAMIGRAAAVDDQSEQQAPTPNVVFAVCDVMDLGPERFDTFDVAISERCLINLHTWEEQQRAIAKIASVLRPGGRFLFIEGSKNGRDGLNRFRESVGLEAMPPVWHNLDFDEQALHEYLQRDFEIEQSLHSGTYDLIARVVHPLLVAPEKPRYEAPINKIAAAMALKRQDCGDIARLLFWVLRKR